MNRLWKVCVGLALGAAAQRAGAQEMQWRPVPAQQSNGVKLLAPRPLDTPNVQPTSFTPAAAESSRVVRAQALDIFPAGPQQPPPPPPPPPGSGFIPNSNEERFNCGVTAKSGEGPSFWDQGKQAVIGIPDAIGGVFNGSSARNPLQSDHAFDCFCSPITNPFYMMDPRSLTEVKPLLIYQRVPGSNYAFQGGDIWFYGLQGRLAITDQFSVVISKLGAITLNPATETKGVTNSTGFAEFAFGPQFTFIRSDSTGTLLAAGLTFDLSLGSSSVFQDTGDMSLVPYISFGQNFGTSSFGSFNFLNTTGYSFATDNTRTDFFFSSFHLDYDVACWHKLYPMLELNYFQYTTNGNAGKFFGFEGRDLVNFGSGGVAGHPDLSLAIGARYKFTEWFQMGLAIEFPLLNREDLMSYRIGFDLIFRY